MALWRWVLLGGLWLGCREAEQPAAVEAVDSAAPVRSVSAPLASASAPVASAAAAPWPAKRRPSVATDWCLEGVAALDEETCYLLPEKPTDTLLIHLHGVVPPPRESPQKTNLQKVVFDASRHAGAAALLPRGDKGLAGEKYRDWWGWPTGEAAYRAHSARLVKRISDKRAALEDVAGVRFARVYLSGSSAGAYYVAALALHGAIEVDGFGAMSGGSGRATAELAGLAPKPFYVGYGAHDTSVGGAARALGELLRGAGWPVKVAEHPLGHGAKRIYLDEAFVFWRQSDRR